MASPYLSIVLLVSVCLSVCDKGWRLASPYLSIVLLVSVCLSVCDKGWRLASPYLSIVLLVSVCLSVCDKGWRLASPYLSIVLLVSVSLRQRDAVDVISCHVYTVGFEYVVVTSSGSVLLGLRPQALPHRPHRPHGAIKQDPVCF